MALNIVRQDLSTVMADAVVLPSNATLQIDGGAGLAVAQVAGLDMVQEACSQLGGCAVGEAKVTPAFDFPARYLIHAVGPLWRGGNGNERQLLAQTYENALQLAANLQCQTVALPLIGSGAFGFPYDVSLSVASDILSKFCESRDIDITLCLLGERAGLRQTRLFQSVADYVERINEELSFVRRQEFAAPMYQEASYSMPAQPVVPESKKQKERRFGLPSIKLPLSGKGKGQSKQEEPLYPLQVEAMPCAESSYASRESLENLLNNLDESFATTLFKLIDASGMTDAQVYRRANMSRQLFSKIRSNPDYRPKKATAVALCIALKLTLPQTRDLLSRAGYSLTHASKFDTIVEYFIVEGDYDMIKINAMLYAHDQELLGCK